MHKELIVTLKVDAKTGEIVAVKNSLEEVERTAKRSTMAIGSFAGKLKSLVAVIGSLYAVKVAFDAIIKSGVNANIALDASRHKLEALVAVGKGFETTTGRVVDAQERHKLILQETNELMGLLKKVNSDTAMGMSELIDVYSLAKPGMDKYNWAVKDQIEILKLVTNTASNFGVSAEELSTGIDDLAAGTWDASSGFGKMMKSLGVTKEEFAKAANKVEYLKKAMADTGAVQDTWAVATSNFSVAWDNLTSKLTLPIFVALKEGIKEFTHELDTVSPEAMDGFTSGIFSMVKVSVKALAFLATGWDAFKLGIKVVQVAISQFGVIAIKVLQGFSSITATVINAMYGAWLDFGDKVRKIWHNIATYAGKVWNKLIGSIVNSKFGKFAADKLGLHFDKLKVDIEPFKKSKREFKAEAKDFSKELAYWEESLNKHKSEEIELAVSINNGDNFKKADAFISKIEASYKKATASAKEHKKSIEKLKSKYSGVSGAIKKGVANAAKAHKKESRANKEASRAHREATKRAKEHAKELKDIAKKAEEVRKSYADMFKDGIGSIFKGDLKGGFSSIFGNITGKLIEPMQNSISDYLGSITQSLTSNLSPLMGGLLGGAMSLLPTLLSSFSSKLTEAEIKDATGSKDFDSKYFEQSAKLWADYAKQGNDLAVRQLDRLKSIDANMATIALGATSTQNGFRLDGKDMVSTKDNGFFGLFATSKTPLGSGIEILTQSIQQLTNNIQARGYQSYKVTDSGLFGLFGGESIETNYRNLSSPLTKALQDTVNKSLDSVADNLSVLGFDDTRFKEEIQKQVVSLGKIDFKDITDPTEQMQVLKAGIGEMLGDAVNGALSSFADPQMLQSLQSWQQAGEDILTTTSRVAVGFKEVDLDLSFFGQHLNNFNQSQELIEAAGGLEAFSGGMQTFIKGFFSTEEQKQYLQMQLNYALGVYNMSLPASKAQFKAMVLEVQQKILTTRATIDTLKAEIAAKVASGQMSLKAAYGQLEGETAIANARAGVTRQQIGANNYLINSAQQAGEASVGFGKSVHNAVNAMVTGAGEAIKQGMQVTPDGIEIDYSRITSGAIREAEAQLNNLEGLYGTLMSNMSSFSSYYNDMGSSISSANNSIASSTNKLLDEKKEYINLINKEIEYRNNLAKAVDDMQKSVQKSFEQLLGKSVPKMLYDLDTAIKNKDYEHISEAFNNYTKGLTDTATSKEQWLRGLISANAKVQGIEKPHELDLLDVNKANEYNTRRLADLYAGVNADKLKSDNWHNKLDKNNELLKELIELQKEANKDGKEIVALTEAQKRDAEASELRAKYSEGVA